MFDVFFCGNSDVMTKAAKAAFNASVDRGITFIDTAEVYGSSVGYNTLLPSLIIFMFHRRSWLIQMH